MIRINEQSLELAANRALMLELMKDDRTSARVRAASLALNMQEGDPEIIAKLSLLINQLMKTLMFV